MKARNDITEKVEHYVRSIVSRYESGHGWSHIERVVKLAKRICETEGKGDSRTVELAALTHDIGDHKFGLHDGPGLIRELFADLGIDDNTTEKVVFIHENISYSKGAHHIEKSDELKIVQDADRLDAMGAVGIARAFSYGGFRGREIYSPADEEETPGASGKSSSDSPSTIHHFYDKLLLLKDLMNTETGKLMASERHDYMLNFLDQFFREWKAER